MKTSPTITMRDFFALPAIRAAQDVQKANPYGSKAHQEATSAILLLADKYDCNEYFD